MACACGGVRHREVKVVGPIGRTAVVTTRERFTVPCADCDQWMDETNAALAKERWPE